MNKDNNQLKKKLIIGTAQLVQQYGITNTTHSKSKLDSLSFLEKCCEYGIISFDTAPIYGSQKILGEFVKQHRLSSQIKIHTKIPSLQKSNESFEDIEQIIESSMEELSVDSLETLFFHDASDFTEVIDKIEYIQRLKHKYNIRKIGFSIYSPSDIVKYEVNNSIFAFQFPYNVVDSRFYNNKIQKKYRFGRSIYLQGLLATPSVSKNYSNKLRIFQNKYHMIMEKNSLSPLHYATSFAFNSDDLDFVVVGLDNISHLNELFEMNLSISKRVDLSALNVTDEIIDPRRWQL